MLGLTAEAREAIGNTEGAELGEDGLRLTVVRYQSPEQSGEMSVRSGVFYLPERKSPWQRHYTTGRYGYGGTERFEGRTLYRRPLVVKASTGGKGPERAYDVLMGKGAYERVRSDVLDALVRGWDRRPTIEDVISVLLKHDGDVNVASEILYNSTKGNTLAYAIQENIVASAVRDAGYDSVISYNKIGGKWRLSEVLDVRERQYPWKTGWVEDYPEFYQELALHRAPSGGARVGAARANRIQLSGLRGVGG